MTLDPFVTVIIPTRNRSDLISNTLLGISIQEYSNYEVLIIDDGSSPDHIDRYIHVASGFGARFRYIELGGRGSYGRGPAKVRNHGLDIAQGTVIAFCDDDDFWTSSSHLGSVAAAFMNDADLDIYIANQVAIRDDLVIKNSWLPGLDVLPSYQSGGFYVSLSDLCSSKDFPQLNILSIRKSLADEINGFWCTVGYEEDRDFFWRAASRARRIVYHPEIVGQHNVPDQNLKANASTSVSWQERWVISTCLSRHILIDSRSEDIKELVAHYDGDISRRLAISLRDNGDLCSAFFFAKHALASRFSWKWLAYVMYLYVATLRGQ